MYINSYSISHLFFKENFVSALTSKQQKIVVIASLAIACLVACFYLIVNRVLKNKKADPIKFKELNGFKEKWKNIVIDKLKCEEEARKAEAAYKQSDFSRHYERSGLYDEPMGTVYGVPARFSLWMPGVALVASHLAAKKNVEGMFVCKSLEAFSSKIKEISLSDSNQRCAFIIGTLQAGLPFPVKPNFPQHKVTVVVEKKEGKLTIALLESQPEPRQNDEIVPEHLTDDLWEGYQDRYGFNNQELVFRAILKACRQAKCIPRLLHSQVLRQRSYGCEVFAIQDAIAYLRDPNFFNKIACSDQIDQLDQDYQLEHIIGLPPEFMVGLQSFKQLQDYKITVGQETLNQPLLGRKKSLQSYLDENLFELGSNREKKCQNHYITRKSFKYLNLLVGYLNELSIDKFKEIIDKTYLTKIDTELFPDTGLEEMVEADHSAIDNKSIQKSMSVNEKAMISIEAQEHDVTEFKLIV